MELAFLPNQADEDEGLSDAGIETFRDAPYASVARECGQNSRDAHSTFPIILTFNRIQIPAMQFPSFDRFRSAINACHAKARDQKELLFFRNAKEIVGHPSIRALVIADSGTKGLVGPCNPGTPFHSLLKGAGVSVKDSDTSGGSFGIGKKAAFAVSELHTVFYATNYISDNVPMYLAQGKCTLVSHINSKGEKLRATGYWGAEDFLPITDLNAAPPWLRRAVTGTTVVSLGFPEASDWSGRVAESLVRNFYAAVHRGEMVFLVDDGSIRIDKDALPTLFNDSTIQAAADRNDSRTELEFAKHSYECIKSARAHQETFEITDLGKLQLRLLIGEGLPKRVAILRNGMMITDSLGYFGDKLTRFAMYKDFVAVLEPVDGRSNQIFKRLENPKHDQLSAERIQDPREQTRIRQAMIHLKQRLREGIRKHTFNPTENSTQIEEMNEFFSDTSETDKLPDPTSKETNPEKIKLTQKVTARHHPPGTGRGHAGGSGTGAGASGGGQSGVGAGSGTGIGGEGIRGPHGIVQIHGLRSLQGPTKKLREFYFTPTKTARATIHLEAFGASESVPIHIIALNGLPASKNGAQLDLVENARQRILVEISEEFRGPIELYFREIIAMESADEA